MIIHRIRRKKRSRDYHINFLPISPYDTWENKIIWDENSLNMITKGKGGWVYQYQDDDETVSKKLRKVISCQNSEIISGKWVNGILWDNDTTYTIDLCDSSDSDDEEEEDDSSLQTKRKRSISVDYDYNENISLVNTAEMLDLYLPHHQEEIRKLELKKKQEEERRKLATPSQSQPASAPQVLPNLPDSQLKGPLYRQQQARDKAERLAKLESFKTPALNTVAALASASVEDSVSNQAAAIRKKKLNALTELEHSTPASRHLTCKVSLAINDLKFYRR